MALHDEILINILRGKIPRKFKTADLKKRPVVGRTDYFQIGEREIKKMRSIPYHPITVFQGTAIKKETTLRKVAPQRFTG